MWGVLLQMMVCVCWMVWSHLIIAQQGRFMVINLVGGETILCMPPCNRLKKVGPSCRHGGCARTRVRPHHWWAPLATAFAWSVRLWALILPVVTDGSSSVFWWGFSIYLWFAPFLNTLSWSALSRVFCIFPRVMPEIDICNKTCEKVSSKPYHLFILFIKMMFIIIR